MKTNLILLVLISFQLLSCQKDEPFMQSELNKNVFIFDQKGGSETAIAEDNIQIHLDVDKEVKEFTDFGYRTYYKNPKTEKRIEVYYYLDGNFVYKIKSKWFILESNINKPKEFKITVLPMQKNEVENLLYVSIKSHKNNYRFVTIKQVFKE